MKKVNGVIDMVLSVVFLIGVGLETFGVQIPNININLVAFLAASVAFAEKARRELKFN